jgi:hypothetical protein
VSERCSHSLGFIGIDNVIQIVIVSVAATRLVAS